MWGSGSRGSLGGSDLQVCPVFLLCHPSYQIFDNFFQVQDPGFLFLIDGILINHVLLESVYLSLHLPHRLGTFLL